MSHHNTNGHAALYYYLLGPHHATLVLLPIDDDGLILMQLWHYRRRDTLSRLPHHCRTLINTHCYRPSFARTLLGRAPRNNIGILLRRIWADAHHPHFVSML